VLVEEREPDRVGDRVEDEARDQDERREDPEHAQTPPGGADATLLLQVARAREQLLDAFLRPGAASADGTPFTESSTMSTRMPDP